MGMPHINSNVLDDWNVWLTGELREAVEQQQDCVPLSAFVHCLEAAATESEQSSLGWLIGRHGNYLSRGVLGRAVTGAGTLGAGLDVLTRFYPLIQDATYVRFEVVDDLVVVSYKILDPTIGRVSRMLYILWGYSPPCCNRPARMSGRRFESVSKHRVRPVMPT